MKQKQNSPLYIPVLDAFWNVWFKVVWSTIRASYLVCDFLPIEFEDKNQEDNRLDGNTNEETQPQA